MLEKHVLELAQKLPFERHEIDGIRVILCPAQIPISHIRACIDVGAVADPPGKEGLAHITEHLLFQGTKMKSVEEISAQLTFLGGHYDAQTSHYATFFSISTGAVDRCAALELLKEIVFEPAFTERTIQSMKEVITNEIVEYENIPEHVVEEEGIKFLFSVHPIRNPILGTKQSIAALTIEDVRKFHFDFYRAQNFVISIAGDTTKALDEIERIFGTIPGGSTPKINLPSEKEATKIERKISRAGIEGEYIWIGFRAPALTDEDRFAFSIANSILRKKLFTQIREIWGLVYDITATYEPFKDVGLATIITHTSKVKAGVVKSKIFEQIGGLKNVSYEEVELAKKRALLSFALDFENPESLADRAIEKEIYGFDYVEILNKMIDTQREEVIEAAKKYFDLSKSTVISLFGE